MLDFVEYVVKGLVDEPEAVNVTEVENNGTTVYELRMDPDDIAKVIGRRGVTINAIRSLIQAGGAKKGMRCGLEIIEDEDDD
ncbi:MAG: KH domain-containing protein [Verrucomicrobia subdivision 3 bacterium]|nr:KH domain-containing protein [Limisphaerales bacterium]